MDYYLDSMTQTHLFRHIHFLQLKHDDNYYFDSLKGCNLKKANSAGTSTNQVHDLAFQFVWSKKAQKGRPQRKVFAVAAAAVTVDASAAVMVPAMGLVEMKHVVFPLR